MFLTQGDTGDDVRALQTILKALGQLDSVDGQFGILTFAAVRRFQRSQLLKGDGIVGPKTWTALLNAAPAEMPPTPVKEFVDGWYTRARKFPIHPGRIGVEIDTEVTVVHTTDMLGGMANLVKRWTLDRNNGVGAHFLLGRRAAAPTEIEYEKWPSAGLVQLVPVNRNGNHAGGGGTFVSGSGAIVHPNRVSVGIEIDCAGHLGRRQANGTFVHKDSGKVIPEADVYIDERGVGWHRVTDYQFLVLDALLGALDAHQKPVRAGLHITPKGTYKDNGVVWGATMSCRVVGHVSLNPTGKTDPGPQVMKWLRERK